MQQPVWVCWCTCISTNRCTVFTLPIVRDDAGVDCQILNICYPGGTAHKRVADIQQLTRVQHYNLFGLWFCS